MRGKSKFLIAVFLLPFLFGCPQGQVEFVKCVQNHQTLTVKTLDDVIWSVQKDLADAKPRMTPEKYAVAEAQINLLVAKLRTIQRQSTLIERYVMSEADQKLISELLKTRWDEAASRPVGE
jgi:hypothetical protein